jgi:hypothetical protein
MQDASISVCSGPVEVGDSMANEVAGSERLGAVRGRKRRPSMGAACGKMSGELLRHLARHR